jgi:hypothetical protein
MTKAAVAADIEARSVPGMGHPTLLDETGCRQIALIIQGEYAAGIVR